MILVVSIALLAVAVTQAGVGKGQEVVKEGVTHVMNPKESSERPSTVEAEELWRIGGEDDEEIFGVIVDIIADDEGNFYLLDAQLNEIKVYSADGEFLRTIGREGEGPGEFRGAFNMFLVPGGNIGVLQAFPSKIIVLTPMGDPAGEYPLPEVGEEDGGFRALLGAQYAGDNLAITYALNQPSEAGFSQMSILALVDSKGETEIRLHSQTSSMSVSNALIAETEWDSFRNRWTATPDGRAFSCVKFGEYSINMWDSQGKLDRVIHREYPDHARNAEEMERLLKIYKGFTRRIPLPDLKFEIEENWNQVQRLWGRDDGTLWVQTSRGSQGLPDGVLGTFDIYDERGHFTRQTTLNGDGDPQNDGYFFVRDRLFVVTDFLHAMMALQGGAGADDEEPGDEVELMEIISYRVD
jgi:hypothetical protein